MVFSIRRAWEVFLQKQFSGKVGRQVWVVRSRSKRLKELGRREAGVLGGRVQRSGKF